MILQFMQKKLRFSKLYAFICSESIMREARNYTRSNLASVEEKRQLLQLWYFSFWPVKDFMSTTYAEMQNWLAHALSDFA